MSGNLRVGWGILDDVGREENVQGNGKGVKRWTGKSASGRNGRGGRGKATGRVMALGT